MGVLGYFHPPFFQKAHQRQLSHHKNDTSAGVARRSKLKKKGGRNPIRRKNIGVLLAYSIERALTFAGLGQNGE